ncbi:spore-associated protein A [Nonomuraea sp. NPDC050404]|uniref:spore-associated protein A n=1 Tax=Nonomuraea sp. NPDC050404 TaxID=3155783 RepID=UPI0033C05882
MTLSNHSRRVAACVLAAVTGAVLMTSPAAAATYAGECGAGYRVVNSAPIGRLGTVFLAYSSASGKNCVIAKRHRAGSRVVIEAGLGVHPVGPHWPAYQGDRFTSYAGPVRLAAAGRCVDWMGRISGVEGGKRRTNCG